MRAFRQLVQLGARGQIRLAVSWLLLGCTRMMIVVLPFSLVRRLLSAGHNSPADLPRLSSVDEGRSHSIAESIAIASTRTPWQSECYPQALTARLELMAARIPHVVTFGLRRDDEGTLKAHAWVRAGNVWVSGGDSSDYTVVGSFPWSPRADSDAA